MRPIPLLRRTSGVLLLLFTAAVAVLWIRSYWVMDVVTGSRWTFKWTPNRVQTAMNDYTASSKRGDLKFSLDSVLIGDTRFSETMPAENKREYMRELTSGNHWEWRQDDADDYSIDFWERSAWYQRPYFYSSTHWAPHDETVIGLADWALVVLSATLASCAFWPEARKLYRRVRSRTGCCAFCGYDLRVHRAGQRCPECGAEIQGAGDGKMAGEQRSDE